MKNSLKPLIIAHRGESNDAPENTMAAINLAWERGADAVEIDIQLSSDHKIVVIHDFNTKRLAGVNKKLKDQPFEDLRKLDVGAWMNPAWTGERIPSIEEVLDSVPDKKKLVIEIKSGSEIIPYLKKAIKNSTLKINQIELIGFDLATMSMAKKALPTYRVLWLLDLDYIWINPIIKPSIKRAINKAKKYNMDGLDVWAGDMLNQLMIQRVHDAGLLLYCWTVNDAEKAKNLMKWGIDAVTTDVAQWLKSQIQDVNNR